MDASLTSARVRLIWLSLLLALTCSFQAQAGSPADSLDLFLMAKMQQLRIPGLQLAVVRHGQVVKLAQYGLANVQDSVPVTRRTRFFLNSITRCIVPECDGLFFRRAIQQKLGDKYFTAVPVQRRQYDAVSSVARKASKR